MTFSTIVPDPGTVSLQFAPEMTDCPLLKMYQLKIPALIGIDSEGKITQAVPRNPAGVIPDSIKDCVFQPYRDLGGIAVNAAIDYFPQ